MQPKEYLLQYRKLRIKIRLLEEDILSLEASIGSAPAQKDKDMPRANSVRNATEDTLIRLVDLKRDKEAMLHKARIAAAEISSTIEELAHIQDPNADVYMTLLYDRYIRCMDWKEIAKEINFNETYTRGTLHGRALYAITPLIWKKTYTN